ncbi:PilN domain-containing protein [Aestuariibacter salexigens]|uniref:PilN domain-containing protein n=1 Tax=Aestuariibacter salexigens TaxID=226010 RepID=UPI00042042B2|nr:PilN domain-containing protein [Aestuariibacter salexigens]
MAHINLLPWRDAQRQHKKQQYMMALLATAIITFLLFWFIGQGFNALIDQQNKRNRYLQDEIAILDAQVAKIRDIKDNKAAIEQRMALIEQLQASRNIAPIVFDELARILPPGIAFKTMKRTGNKIEILGISESNNRLSRFMRELEDSKVFTQGVLSSIVADTEGTDAVSDFKLTFSISPSIAPIVSVVEQEKAK